MITIGLLRSIKQAPTQKLEYLLKNEKAHIKECRRLLEQPNTRKAVWRAKLEFGLEFSAALEAELVERAARGDTGGGE